MIIKDNVCYFCIKNICSDLSSEPSHRDGSDEGSEHMVSMRNKKKLSLSYHQYPLLPALSRWPNLGKDHLKRI